MTPQQMALLEDFIRRYLGDGYRLASMPLSPRALDTTLIIRIPFSKRELEALRAYIDLLARGCLEDEPEEKPQKPEQQPALRLSWEEYHELFWAKRRKQEAEREVLQSLHNHSQD